jgi:hypothetical protein
MCAMKEVTLFSDDAKSKESAKQLMQVTWSPVDLRNFLFVWMIRLWLFYNFGQISHLVACFDWKQLLHSVLAGNCFIEPFTTPKYCAVLWVWNGRFITYDLIYMFVIIVLYGFEISISVHALDDSNFKEVFFFDKSNFKEVFVNINLLWWFLSHELLGTNFLLLWIA